MSGRGRSTRGRPRPGFLLVQALVGVAVLAACVGSVTKQDLDEEMRSRGSGGIGERLLTEAVQAVLDALGARDVHMRSLTASPGQVTMHVRVPETSNIDSYDYGTSGLYGGRGLDGPSPVSVSRDGPPLETQVFLASEAGVDRFDEMADQALAEAALAGGYVEGATIRRSEAHGGPVVTIRVTNERTTGVAVSFTPDGSLIGVEQ